jgi:hypothetical protein
MAATNRAFICSSSRRDHVPSLMSVGCSGGSSWVVLDLARSVMPLSIPVEGSALAAACRVGRSELSPKEGDSTTDGLGSRCPQGAVGQLPERSRVPLLVNCRLSGSIQAQGRAETQPSRGVPRGSTARGSVFSPSGPGRFQQHSHNGAGWAGRSFVLTWRFPAKPSSVSSYSPCADHERGRPLICLLSATDEAVPYRDHGRAQKTSFCDAHHIFCVRHVIDSRQRDLGSRRTTPNEEKIPLLCS